MQNKWTEDKKKQGLLPNVGEVVLAILGINEEAKINVRGYSIDGKMVFGQDITTGGAIICNVDWLHPIQSEREKYEKEMMAWLNKQSEYLPNLPDDQAVAFFKAGLSKAYELLKPFKDKN